MSISAMKQALEALELIDKDIDWHDKSPTRKFCNQAAHSLRQAIEQAEKQEPLCWVYNMNDLIHDLKTINYGTVYGQPVEGMTPLYAAPVHASDMSEKHVQISDKNRHEWGSVTDDALIEEVRRRGFPIRGAQISLKIKDEYELCCQKYDTCTEPCTPRGRHLAKHEWVGLTDEEVHNAFNFVEFVKQISFDRDRPEWCKNFAAYLEAKLKEKNT